MGGSSSFRVSPDAYDRWVGRYGAALAAALVAEAGVEQGDRVLDVGCGPAALTKVLAELVGASAVSAVDPSEPFVAAAKERVPGVDVRLGQAESLPFADDTFDAALAQLVVNFMTDAEQGVREMARVTRPGGVVAACVWDYGGRMDVMRAFWDAAIEIDPSASDLDEAKMSYSREGELAELWRSAGLSDVRGGSITVQAGYDDFEDLASPFPAGVGPVGAYFVSLAADARTDLLGALRRRLGDPQGPFTLSARAWTAVGRV